MSPDEQGSSWEARRTKLLPTLQAYLVLGSKRTSPRRMRLEARFRRSAKPAVRRVLSRDHGEGDRTEPIP